MLALLKKIGDERLDVMTTDDYLLLSALFLNKNLGNIDPARFKHLAELEIVKYTERGFEWANGGVTLSSDCQANISVDWQSLETSDRKKQILAFISSNDRATSSQIANFIGLTQGRVRTILRELAAEGLITKSGDNRYATYSIIEI